MGNCAGVKSDETKQAQQNLFEELTMGNLKLKGGDKPEMKEINEKLVKLSEYELLSELNSNIFLEV